MSRLTDHQIAQEARRILRRLASPRQTLRARDGHFAVSRGLAGLAASRVTVAEDAVAAFQARGWIAADGPGCFVIAPAGRDFLTRSLGGEAGFADQHRLMEDMCVGTGEAARTARVNRAESPLARLKFRGLIDDLQFAAGEKLRRDFTLGQLGPRLGVDLTRAVMAGGGGQDNISDVALAARQRFNRALSAAGPGLSDLLFDVCCHLAPLENAEDKRGWAKRSGRVVLKIALDRLAAHYGLDVMAGRAGIRAWHDDTVEEAV
jgi:hypothetical protein